MADSNSSGNTIDFKLYRYTPSLPAAIVASVLFLALTTWHLLKLIRYKSYYFTAFIIGGLCQTIGYCGRIVSHFNNNSIPAYSVQAILILIAPALFAASVYMILGRVILATRSSHLSLIPVHLLTKAFVLGDIVSFTLQAAGGGIQAAGTLELYHLGEKIIVIGLFIQIVVFGFFVITSIVFNKRIRQRPTQVSVSERIPWQRHLTILYIVSGIILVRSIFRVVEYLGGNDGYLIRHEIFLYAFDSILMAGVMAIFVVFYIDDLGKADMKDREELNLSIRDLQPYNNVC